MASEPKISDRDLEKVIETIRLSNIEKEIRSKTSILDVRKIHHVEEVVNPLAAEKEAIKHRAKIFDRRPNNAAKEIRVHGALAKALLEEKGVKVDEAIDVFENEENIWKNKSHQTNYFLKRKFDDPQLHNYSRTMSPSARKEFEHLTKENLYKMSEKMRVSSAITIYLRLDIIMLC